MTSSADSSASREKPRINSIFRPSARTTTGTSRGIRGFGGSALRAAAQRLRAEPEVRLARVEIIAEQIPQEVPVVVRTGGLRIELMRGFSREALESALGVIEGRRR